MSHKLPCTKCGTLIFPATVKRNIGRCAPDSHHFGLQYDSDDHLYSVRWGDDTTENELDNLFEYGKYFLNGGYFHKTRIEQDKKAGIKFLAKATIYNHAEASSYLENLREKLSTSSEPEDKDVLSEIYSLDGKILKLKKFRNEEKEKGRDKMIEELLQLKERSSGSRRFILSVSAGITTFFITRSVFGEGVTGYGTVGLAVASIIVLVLLITRS